MESLGDAIRRIIRYEEGIIRILEPRLEGKTALSIGSGKGTIEARMQGMSGIKITGAEVSDYGGQEIETRIYDGRRLPFGPKRFDCSFFIYSLHHTPDIPDLLKEAKRVTKGPIIILDHTYSGWLGKSVLKAFDWFANLSWRMPLPYNFLREREWIGLFRRLGLGIEESRVTEFTVFFKVRAKTKRN